MRAAWDQFRRENSGFARTSTKLSYFKLSNSTFYQFCTIALREFAAFSLSERQAFLDPEIAAQRPY